MTRARPVRHPRRLLGVVLAVGVIGAAGGGCSVQGRVDVGDSANSGPATVTQTVLPSAPSAPVVSPSSEGSPAASEPSVPFGLTPIAGDTPPDQSGIGTTGVVRVGRHPGYDRVVLQFNGSGRPSFEVRYVDQPIGDPSGQLMPVAGAAYLQVTVGTLDIPGATASAPSKLPASAFAGLVVAQADPVFGGFEGRAQTFIGVRDRQRPFRAFTMLNPSRLVIDVQR